MTTEKNLNLASIVTVDFGTKQISVVRRVKVPFVEQAPDDRKRIDYFDVIGTYADLIITAIEARREACLDMLMRNLNNIVSNDGIQVTFKKNNGTYHTFNVPSYEAMEDIIDFMRKGDFKSLNHAHFDQIAKALYWVEKPTSDRNGISFGNLISCIMEIVALGIPEKRIK